MTFPLGAKVVHYVEALNSRTQDLNFVCQSVLALAETLVLTNGDIVVCLATTLLCVR